MILSEPAEFEVRHQIPVWWSYANETFVQGETNSKRQKQNKHVDDRKQASTTPSASVAPDVAKRGPSPGPLLEEKENGTKKAKLHPDAT